MKSGMILDQELIGKDETLTKFWNKQTIKKSKKLWLPIETDCVGLHSNWSKTSLQKMESNSWFSMKTTIPVNKNCQKICSQSYKSISVKKMEREDILQNQKISSKMKSLNQTFTDNQRNKLISDVIVTYMAKFNKETNKNIVNETKLNKLVSELEKKIKYFNNKPSKVSKVSQSKIKSLKKIYNKRIKVKKLRLYVNDEQKNIFKQWCGTCRYLYNTTLYDIKENKEKINFIKLRNKYIPKSVISEDNKWMLDIPKEVRAESINDLCKAYDSTFKLLNNGTIKKFNMNYRKKKNDQSIVLPSSALKFDDDNNLQLYKRILKENSLLKFNKREKIPKIEFNCRLKLAKPNIWILYIPYTEAGYNGIENQDAKILSLDPGVRTFLTGYSPNGSVIKIGDQDISRLIRLCLLIDKMQSKISSKDMKCYKRLRILNKMQKLRLKIKNLKEDMHWKVCNYLCNNYNYILLPTFEVSNMIVKNSRKIKSKTVRKLLNLNHGAFRERLKTKALDKKDCYIIMCNESFTSKTCTNCGTINETLGGKKKFKCLKCHISVDRDINGARNILLRALGADPVN